MDKYEIEDDRDSDRYVQVVNMATKSCDAHELKGINNKLWIEVMEKLAMGSKKPVWWMWRRFL